MRILAAFALVIAGIAGIVMAQKAQTDKKDSQPGKVAEQAKTPRLSPEDVEEKLAELDEQAAERDREFAERDQEFAERDQEFAERDHEAAERDQELTEKDEEQDAPEVAAKPAPHVSAK